MSQKQIEINSTEQLKSLVRSSSIVVAKFYADGQDGSDRMAIIYDNLAKSLSRASLVVFVKVDKDKQPELAEQYDIISVPTFVIHRNGNVVDTVEANDNPKKLIDVVQNLAKEIESLGERSNSGSASGSDWTGAQLPKGYSDITDQIETQGLELLNADEDAGPVKVLFESSKPSALSKGKVTATDWVQSGADDQLLLYIRFQSAVKLHTLQLTSLPPTDAEDPPARPGVIHLFINRPQNMDFSEADDSEPTQVIELSPEDWNAEGTASVGLRFVKFQKTTTLVIYVQQGDGEAEKVRLDRVKLIGEAGPKREMGKLQKVGDEE